MFIISKQGRFEASHILEGHQGKCGRLHGHRYIFEVELSGLELDVIGILFDFTDLPVKAVEEVYDHQHLNDVDHPQLRLKYTSAEYLAFTIFQFFKSWLFDVKVDNVAISAVTVWETAKCKATYREK